MGDKCWYQIKIAGKEMLSDIFLEAGISGKYQDFGGRDDWDAGLYIWMIKGECDNNIDTDCIDESNDPLVNRICHELEPASAIRNYTLRAKSEMLKLDIECLFQYENYDLCTGEGKKPEYVHYKDGQLIEKMEMSYDECKTKAYELFETSKCIYKYDDSDYYAGDDFDDDDENENENRKNDSNDSEPFCDECNVVEKEDFLVAEDIELMGYTGESTKVMVPEWIEIIGDCAFFELDVEEIIIPQSVRTIREGSIMYCDSLKKIVIPFNTKVEDNAICDCEELVIYTQKGSSADKYAQENDIPVEYV